VFGRAAGGELYGALFCAFLLQVLLWTLVAVLLPLRRVRGWRWTLRDGAATGERGRFRIGDLLIWMVIMGVPLAFVRLVVASSPEGVGNLLAMRVLATLAIGLLLLLWAVMLAALAPRGWRQSWLYAVGIPLYVIVATALATPFLLFPLFEPLIWPRPGWTLSLEAIAYFVLPSLVVWLNCRALRRLGYRLVRPAWSSPAEAVTLHVLDSSGAAALQASDV
jgi:hypothetical protein